MRRRRKRTSLGRAHLASLPQGPGQGSSSVSSGNVEQQYILRPQGTFQFTVGSTSYTLDFTAMTQTNSATRVQRNVRRRPKFNSIVSGNARAYGEQQVFWPLASAPRAYGEQQSCSLDSAGIERHYQKNPKGQIRFKAGRYSYTLDFSGMCQTNVRIGTKRTVRRTQCEAQQMSSPDPKKPVHSDHPICSTSELSHCPRHCPLSGEKIPCMT
ncbi:unnamed protein product [Coregonus sp. 'balchen']|nr:unnamed protein product [Coregonus sp. 'balchen']